MAEKAIVRGKVRKPHEEGAGQGKEAIIQYGVRTPKSSYDRRPDMRGGVTYIGPSKQEGRRTGISGGHGQSKKHVSTGKGQR